MGYGTDVRFITTKQGYREMKNYIQENSENNHGLQDLLEDVDIYKKVRDLILLGWTDLRGDSREAIREISFELYDKDITFRYLGIGENLEDIEQINYTAPKDTDRYIPYPSITREFDDKYLSTELKHYQKDYDKERNIDNEMEE